MKRILVFKLCVLLLLAFQYKVVAQKIIVSDPLTSSALVEGEIWKTGVGGQYTEKGWQATGQGDYLKIEVSDEAGFEGSLEVDIQSLEAENTGSNRDTKIHFLNMFSNPIADHHVEDGGTSSDALWTLRTGSDQEGKPRYGENFKILWASKGAKRTENSDYHEEIVQLTNNRKRGQTPYKIKVTWSQKEKSIKVFVDHNLVFNGQWLNQESPLRYIWLAKSPDFQALVGQVFSNLKVYAH